MNWNWENGMWVARQKPYKEMPKPKFKIGDLVQLDSGWPDEQKENKKKRTVIGIYFDDDTNEFSDGTIMVQYTYNGKRDECNQCCLKHYEEEK